MSPSTPIRGTTKLYDRRRQQVTRGEVERIRYERKAQTPGGAQG